MSRSFVRTLTWLGGILGAIGLLLYLFVFDVWLIPSSDPLLLASIKPMLFAEDRVLVRRDSEGSLKTGQLARCASPDPRTEFVVGRVMGRTGDSVEIRDERVLINGKPMPSRHGCPPVALTHPVTGQQVTLACHAEENGTSTYWSLAASAYPEGGHTAVVGPGKIFLVSDNRHIHKDSRDYGQVDASTCEHIVFRLWGETFRDSSRRFTVLY